MRLRSWVLCALFVLPSAASAGETPELVPAAVSIKGKLSVREFLIALKKQTGHAVIDARAKTDDRVHDWNLPKATFWSALDALAEKTGARVSPFHAPGAISLLDGPPKNLCVAHDGLFRIQAERVSLLRDLAEGGHHCQLSLLATWEPHFRPYYLEVGKWDIIYGNAKKDTQAHEAPAQGKQELSGAGATLLSASFPAPEKRDLDRIKSVKGVLNVIGPTRMLTFQFDKLAPLEEKDAPRVLSEAGVRVSLREVKVGRTRWSFTVQVENPKGVPEFESYQSWLGNNRINLSKDKDKTVWEPDLAVDQEVLKEDAHYALVRYSFTGSEHLKTKIADWRLSYTTPHRIIAIPVRFEIKDIPLP
jgi:hypothetical protein